MEELTSDQEGPYHSVIETLFQTFKEVLSRDIICTIVENFDGDLNESANAIMNITNDDQIPPSLNSNQPAIINNDTINKPSIIENMEIFDFPENNKTQANSKQFMEAQSLNTLGASMTQTAVSYSGAEESVAMPKHTNIKTNAGTAPDLDFMTNQIEQILMHHRQGSRLLIIMRGAPGSGKTFLAKKILEAAIGHPIFDFKMHIFSADDYFMLKGSYQFEKTKLADAHMWNQIKARVAMNQGLSPVFIDNTNIEMWEMEPYLRDAVKNGYLIEIVEPNTSWAKRANALARKNIHGVPMDTIKRMLDEYEYGITPETLMKYYQLSYPENLIPPVLRNLPVMAMYTQMTDQKIKQKLPEDHTNIITHEDKSERNYNVLYENSYADSQEIISTACTTQLQENNIVKSDNSFDVKGESDEQLQQLQDYTKIEYRGHKTEQMMMDQEKLKDSTNSVSVQSQEIISTTSKNQFKKKKLGESDNSQSVIDESSEQLQQLENYAVIEKELVESDKNFSEWYKNAKWVDDDTYETQSGQVKTSIGYGVTVNKSFEEPFTTPETPVTPSMEHVLKNCHDWSKISTFVFPRENNVKPDIETPLTAVKIFGSSTFDDTHSNKTKAYLLPSESGDSNDFDMRLQNETLIENNIINKEALVEITKSDNEKTKFEKFRQLFKYIAKPQLRAIFDSCYGDVLWASSILLDCVANDELLIMLKSEDLSDTDDENFETDEKITEQECNENMTGNNLFPYDNSVPSTSVKAEESCESTTGNTPILPKKSIKMGTSECAINLKRQIEKNFVISENHYSIPCLKIRERRQRTNGELEALDNNDLRGLLKSENIEFPDSPRSLREEELPTTFNSDEINELNTTTNTNHFENEDNNGSSEIDFNNSVKTVNIELGWHFLAKLDQYYSRDIAYPDHIKPKINIPTYLLNEINALWMESFTDQLEVISKEELIKQDAKMASQLETKEVELAIAKKDQIPNLKELMDNEYALSLYRKYTADWRSKLPTNLAAKLTRDKLNNLFPEIHPDVLSELLMAYNNNFFSTVEVLLLSTGRTDILEKENGLKDYIVAKEAEHRRKLLKQKREIERKIEVLTEDEEPLVLKGGEKVKMKVEQYRDEANMHRTIRNQIYQKARESYLRGMPQAASYYSGVAELHSQKSERAHALAAAALIEIGTQENAFTATLDLHHLRVREAREALDLFLDMNINKLREIQYTSSVQYMTLYFVTGRGLHSPGLPKIKPAVINRLKDRNVSYIERNPGLLMSRIYAAHKMINECTAK